MRDNIRSLLGFNGYSDLFRSRYVFRIVVYIFIFFYEFIWNFVFLIILDFRYCFIFLVNNFGIIYVKVGIDDIEYEFFLDFGIRIICCFIFIFFRMLGRLNNNYLEC